MPGVPIVKIGDIATGVSQHYTPPTPALPIGPPIPYPVSGPITDAGYLVPIPPGQGVFADGAPIAVEGAKGVHVAPVCIPNPGAISPTAPALHTYKVGFSTLPLQFFVHGSKVLGTGSVSEHCADLGLEPVSIGSVVGVTIVFVGL